MKGITIFYPMHNEEQYIRRAVEAAKEVVNRMVKDEAIDDYEILIIDDASTDSTGKIADELSASDQRIKAIHHTSNRGLGGSIKTGFNNAKMDFILYSDADLPFDMMELQKAYRLMCYYEADIVSAFRFDRTGEGLKRLFYSYIYNLLIKLLFKFRVRDVNFAFKLIHKDVLNYVTLKSEGSFIDAELLIKAEKYGFKIIQFGTNYFPRSRGASTLSSPSTILKILKELISMYREIKSIKPVKIKR